MMRMSRFATGLPLALAALTLAFGANAARAEVAGLQSNESRLPFDGPGGSWSELRSPNSIRDRSNSSFEAAATQSLTSWAVRPGLDLLPFVTGEIALDAEGTDGLNRYEVAAGLRLRQALSGWGYVAAGVQYAYEKKFEAGDEGADVVGVIDWATWSRAELDGAGSAFIPNAFVTGTWARIKYPDALDDTKNNLQVMAQGEAGLVWAQFGRNELLTMGELNYSANSERFGDSDTWSVDVGPRMLFPVKNNGNLRVGVNYVHQWTETDNADGVEVFAGWNVWW